MCILMDLLVQLINLQVVILLVEHLLCTSYGFNNWVISVQILPKKEKKCNFMEPAVFGLASPTSCLVYS